MEAERPQVLPFVTVEAAVHKLASLSMHGTRATPNARHWPTPR
jgi:hypothetical protein